MRRNSRNNRTGFLNCRSVAFLFASLLFLSGVESWANSPHKFHKKVPWITVPHDLGQLFRNSVHAIVIEMFNYGPEYLSDSDFDGSAHPNNLKQES
jgi:hypothetical protein